MNDVEAAMKGAIKAHTSASIHDYAAAAVTTGGSREESGYAIGSVRGAPKGKSKTRDEWVLSWPGQVVLAVDQIYWTHGVESALRETKAGVDASGKNSLGRFLDTQNAQLNGIVRLVRSRLTSLQRATLSALTTIDVHARDVVEHMVRWGRGGERKCTYHLKSSIHSLTPLPSSTALRRFARGPRAPTSSSGLRSCATTGRATRRGRAATAQRRVRVGQPGLCRSSPRAANHRTLPFPAGSSSAEDERRQAQASADDDGAGPKGGRASGAGTAAAGGAAKKAPPPSSTAMGLGMAPPAPLPPKEDPPRLPIRIMNSFQARPSGSGRGGASAHLQPTTFTPRPRRRTTRGSTSATRHASSSRP